MDRTYRRRPIEVALPACGVFALESRHGPGFRMASQRHDFLEVFYVLDGAGAFHLEGTPHPCRKGDVVVVPPGWTHRLEDDPARPLALYGICVAPRVLAVEPTLMDQLKPGPRSVGAALAAQLRADLRRLLFEQTLTRPGSGAWVVGQTLQLLVLLARSHAEASDGFASPEAGSASAYRQAVRDYVAELPHRFFEATDLDQTAADLGMSRRRFTQLFREATGSSWSSYLTRLRLDYACQLLQEARRSITAVAFECGFEDLSNFYKAFKRRTGLPPHAWRTGQVPS